MAKSTTNDAQALVRSLRTAYAAAPTNLKIIDLYVLFAISTALIQVMRYYGFKRSVVLGGKEQKEDDGSQYLNVVYQNKFYSNMVVYMGIVGSFPFNSFLSGVLSCIGTAVLAVCLRIQVNKENKEFKDLPPERAFADFVLCNLVLHLVIMNFLG